MVSTRSASLFDSVQWLNAEPLTDSTTKPWGMGKLSRKMPALEISTVAFTASTVRSSPRESVSCVSTRTSGSTAEARREREGETGNADTLPGLTDWKEFAGRDAAAPRP